MNHAKPAKYHQCLYVYKFVNQKGLAAMVATKRYALHAGEEAWKQGILPWLWNQVQISQKDKITIGIMANIKTKWRNEFKRNYRAH